MMDHRGLNGSYYSFCKGKVVGDDTYHCKECETCSGLDHWHSHRYSFSYHSPNLPLPLPPSLSPSLPPSLPLPPLALFMSTHNLFLSYSFPLLFLVIATRTLKLRVNLRRIASFCIPFRCPANYWPPVVMCM